MTKLLDNVKIKNTQKFAQKTTHFIKTRAIKKNTDKNSSVITNENENYCEKIMCNTLAGSTHSAL
jgi:hypothetical protein